ncbi:uncharacterized protein TrAFT101_008834 [Trichoderma asperellum]|uniref:uncharacterized protein n=1 Tax=Trichoderma asperellum TaxID=101201 RepID=UPI003325937E|nr:hypothetical protein TrAFT101_008834 [Trichoderma asperellum]
MCTLFCIGHQHRPSAARDNSSDNNHNQSYSSSSTLASGRRNRRRAAPQGPKGANLVRSAACCLDSHEANPAENSRLDIECSEAEAGLPLQPRGAEVAEEAFPSAIGLFRRR